MCACVCGLVSCVQFWKPTDCSPPDSSVHGIILERILEWVAISFPRGSSQQGIEPMSPVLADGFFTTEPPGKYTYTQTYTPISRHTHISSFSYMFSTFYIVSSSHTEIIKVFYLETAVSFYTHVLRPSEVYFHISCKAGLIKFYFHTVIQLAEKTFSHVLKEAVVY